MSITWSKKVKTVDGREVWEFDKETHKGLVMSSSWRREVRAMSDVYCDASYVQVWNPETKEAETICLGYHFECSDQVGQVYSVDCPPEILREQEQKAAARAAEQVKREAAEQEVRAEKLAEQTLKEPKIGSFVEVVRGRKVPTGFRGTVFWMGSNNYGPKLGIKNDAGETRWTAASNVETIIAGPKAGQTWVQLLEETRASEEAQQKLLPKKGDTVRHEMGVVGKVFWCEKTRLGMSRDGSKSDPIWCNAWEVEVLNPDGTTKFKMEKPSNLPQQPKKHPLPEFPEPFCSIRAVRLEPEGWAAFDEAGTLIIRLPKSSAEHILSLLST